MNTTRMSTAVQLACLSKKPAPKNLHAELAATIAAYKQQSAELARMLAGEKDIHAQIAETVAALRQTMRRFAPVPAAVHHMGSNKAA